MKFSSQNTAAIKGVPPLTPSRAFGLWLALLFLYFMLLPTAADTPDADAAMHTSDGPAVSVVSRHHL